MTQNQQQHELIERYDLLIKQIEDRIALCRDRELMRSLLDGRTSLAAKRDELLKLHGPLPTKTKDTPDKVSCYQAPGELAVNTPIPNDPPLADQVPTFQEAPRASRKPVKLSNLPKRVKVHPTIAGEVAAPAKKLAPIAAVWYLLRAWDIENQAGRGKVSREDARELLTGLGQWGHISWRRLRQILGQGQGVTWDIGAGYIWLYAPWRVAKFLDIGRLQYNPVWVNTYDLARGVKRARAQFYTVSFNATREASPITRSALQTITGVSPRTQQDYDKLAKTKAQRNIAITPHRWKDDEARELISWKRGKSIFRFIDWTGKHEKKGSDWIAYGLPNSYESALKHAPRGRQKKHNKRLDLVERREPGNDDDIVRIYHQDGKKAGRALEHEPEHDHYWQRGRSLQQTVKKKAKLTGVNVWNVLSFQGVASA